MNERMKERRKMRDVLEMEKEIGIYSANLG